MADLYTAYLLALLVLPLLVRWRWGLVASLVVCIAELGLVILLYPLITPPDPHPVGWSSAESPIVQIRRRQAEGYARLFLGVMIPALAALIGGGLSVAWSVILVVWRLLRRSVATVWRSGANGR
jgi:hypothetical protein